MPDQATEEPQSPNANRHSQMCAGRKAATTKRQADKQNCDLTYNNQTQNNHTIVLRALVDTPGKDTKHLKQPKENNALIRIQSQSAQTANNNKTTKRKNNP